MTTRVGGLTGATRAGPGGLPRLRLVAVERRACAEASAPGSTRPRRSGGAWGAVYYDDDGRTLGSMQYGPAVLFPRAWELPAGPPSEDAALITCAYLVDRATPWVLQSLFLAAIGDAKDKRAKALETFAYRYAEGESAYERFLVHRTVFPRDFLSDFGFETVRRAGQIELVRLDLGGLQPVVEGSRAKVLRVVKEAFAPEPAPVPRGP